MTPFAATDAIVKFSTTYRLQSEDPAVVERARLLVLDYLGVAFAAARTAEGDVPRLAAMVRVAGGAATIVGQPVTASPGDAAMVNGYAAHLFEFDDSTLNPVGHPSVTILPGLLSLAEARGCRGEDVLAAYLVGLEVHGRLGQAKTSAWTADDPWLPLGTIGLVAAVAAGSRLLGLDQAQRSHALGLAVHLAGGLSVSNGTSAKPLGAGHAARSAVHAIELAETGFSGPERAIERPGGFGDVFLRANTEDLRAALERLGGPAHLAEVGVAIKRYPSCYGTHWSVDALRGLMTSNGLLGEDVRAVELVYPRGSAFLDDPDPRSVHEARFSLQYGLATCLLDGYPRLESFTEQAVAAPRMREAMARVAARAHPPETPQPECWRHAVTVTATDGSQYSGSVKHPRGHPRNPVSAEEIKQKFLANVAAMPEDRAQAAVRIVEAIDHQQDVRQLLQLFLGEEHS